MEAIQASGISITPKTVVARTERDFIDGVCSGYLTNFHEYQVISLSDRNLYTFLVNTILDVQCSDLFNAGYCTGWIGALIEALLEDRRVFR